MFISIHFANSQQIINGKISDGIYGDPIPFCQILINNDKLVLSDGLGRFKIKDSIQIDFLVFKAPFHKEIRYKVLGDSLSLDIRLPAFTLFLPLTQNEAQALDVIQSWQRKSQWLNPELSKNYSFKSYSRTALSSNDVRRFKDNYNKYLKLFGQGLNYYPQNHYLIFSQNQTQVQFKDRFSYQKNIQKIQSLGLDDPADINLTNGPYEISLYEDFWRIGNKYFPNPLSGNTSKRYHFKIIDTLSLNSEEILMIKFYPHIDKKAGKLRGIIYFNKNRQSISAFWAERAIETKSRLRITAHYEVWNELNIPTNFTLNQNLSEIQSYSTLLKLQNEEVFSDYNRDQNLGNEKFDEIIVEYQKYKPKADDSFGPFETDSLINTTEEFYNKNPQLSSVYRGLNFGKELFKGHVPLGKFELDIRRILNYNNHEGFRFGIGGKTSEAFSKNNETSIYAAYGLRDEKVKYGASHTYFLGKPLWNRISLFGSKDVFESGSSTFEQQELNMFNSEDLRRFGISIMDNSKIIGSRLNIKVAKYLQANIAYSFKELQPSYDYQFNNDINNTYQYSDLELGFRFAFGEERSLKGRNLVIEKQPYPVFLLNYTRGMENMGSDFAYNRIDLRTNFQKRILGYGTSSIQVNVGIIDRSLPYHKLYVARGGLRNFSVVFHNTFETMGYNEFLSDRYFSIFYSHNFGPMYVSFLNHFPSLEMQHNFGIGSLRNPNLQNEIDFKIMNKGYLESGLFVNDILLFNISGLKTGVGTGFFYRYGAYQNPRFIENIVAKISLNLDF